jgi:hypothetical protein
VSAKNASSSKKRAVVKALEDKRDLRDVRAARKESIRKGTKSLDRLRAELGD